MACPSLRPAATGSWCKRLNKAQVSSCFNKPVIAGKSFFPDIPHVHKLDLRSGCRMELSRIVLRVVRQRQLDAIASAEWALQHKGAPLCTGIPGPPSCNSLFMQAAAGNRLRRNDAPPAPAVFSHAPREPQPPSRFTVPSAVEALKRLAMQVKGFPPALQCTCGALHGQCSSCASAALQRQGLAETCQSAPFVHAFAHSAPVFRRLTAPPRRHRARGFSRWQT